jgi:ectoine hydroxylase-related dioxygenase (phytanoyl-CoA dioxygenase family)
MTDEERYFFDVCGYIVIPNALTPETVAAMNAYLDTRADLDPTGRGTIHGGNLLTWSPEFREVIDNPRVLPYLVEVLGDTLRLDHDYAIISEASDTNLQLHGGGTPYDPAQYYHTYHGRIYCGLTVASYALADIPQGEGGFVCIPGSHKANFPLSDDLRFYRKESPLLRQVPMNAGDCVIFTEALTHGTLPWRAKHHRRSLFYKYSPKHMTWARRYYVPAEGRPTVAEIEPLLTERQRILLDPPSVDKHRRVSLTDS